MKFALLIPCGASALLSLLACGGDPAASVADAPVAAPQDPKPLPRARVDHETVRRLFAKDPPAEEVDNPSTPEKLALGNALYHDASLSKDGAVSCAACHPLANYGQDGKAASPMRNTPSTWNAYRQFRQAWDGRAASVEEHVGQALLDPTQHGLADEAALVDKLKAKPATVDLFAKAFGAGDVVTAANARLAIGAFLRSLTTKSRWDEYLGGGKGPDGKDVLGNSRALTNDELFGLKAFMDVGCMTCHVGRLVGGHMYQKTGLLKAYSSKDEGRGALTKSDADKFFFKVPSLLNVEKTAPYLHDGKVATLEEVVKLMADIQLDKKLSDDQVRGIVAFLKALTGPLPADEAKK